MEVEQVNPRALERFLVRHWKLLLNLLVFAALIALAIGLRHQIGQSLTNLGSVNAWFLALLIPLEFANYDAQARLYQSLFKLLGDRMSYWFGFELSLELNFINLVFPSGGVSGISYFGARLRRHTSASRAVLVQMLKLIMNWVAFEAILIIGLFVLASRQDVNNLTILITAVVSTLIIVGTLIFIFVVGSKARINTTVRLMVRLVNWMIRRVPYFSRHQIKVDRLRHPLDELHDSYKKIGSQPRLLNRSYWQAFYMDATEVLALYAVFLAFGHSVNIGAVIIAYAVANFAGVMSVLPGGVGIYEGLMTAVLIVAGVPAGISLPAVVMYRIVSTIIQLPPGYYFYQRHQIRGKSAA